MKNLLIFWIFLYTSLTNFKKLLSFGYFLPDKEITEPKVELLLIFSKKYMVPFIIRKITHQVFDRMIINETIYCGHGIGNWKLPCNQIKFSGIYYWNTHVFIVYFKDFISFILIGYFVIFYKFLALDTTFFLWAQI